MDMTITKKDELLFILKMLVFVGGGTFLLFVPVAVLSAFLLPFSMDPTNEAIKVFHEIFIPAAKVLSAISSALVGIYTIVLFGEMFTGKLKLFLEEGDTSPFRWMSRNIKEEN